MNCFHEKSLSYILCKTKLKGREGREGGGTLHIGNIIYLVSANRSKLIFPLFHAPHPLVLNSFDQFDALIIIKIKKKILFNFIFFYFLSQKRQYLRDIQCCETTHVQINAEVSNPVSIQAFYFGLNYRYASNPAL